MKTQSLKALFAFLLLSFVTAPVWGEKSSDDYTLVWSDEFDTDGRPSEENWNYEEGFIRNREWQWYQPENAFVRDGVLVITAKRERKPNPTFSEGATYWGAQRKDIECTSACLITEGKHEFLYGRFEVRARLSGARGSWPAIWFKGANGLPWPSRGEVDLMEYYPNGTTAALHANACWAGTGAGRASQWNARSIPFAHWTERDSLWTTQFHTWRMDWTEQYIRLYLDDELLNDIDITHTINGKGSPGEGVNPFHTPMFLLLNLAMGSTGGPVDEASLPTRFEVDYVRVYQ